MTCSLQHMSDTHIAVSLSGPDTARIRLLLRSQGESTTAARLGIARQTLGRLLAGLPVQRGTLALVRERLTANDSAEAGQ